MSKKRTPEITQEDIVTFEGLPKLPSIQGLVQDVKGQETLGHDLPTSKSPKKSTIDHNIKNTVTADEWNLFLEFAEYYQGKGEKGTVIWIDTDLKDTLEQLKKGELHYSLRHLVNAILRTWIEKNKEQLKTTMKTKKGLL